MRTQENARDRALLLAQKVTAAKGGKADKKNAKKRRGASSVPSSSSSLSSSSSSASSSGPSHAVAASLASQGEEIDWFITPLATKHFTDLVKKRGYESKFYTYLDQIKADPWNSTGHGDIHALGRTKLMKGYDNVFKTRFGKKERLYYHVEKQGGGRIAVTILGLMKHDLNKTVLRRLHKQAAK